MTGMFQAAQDSHRGVMDRFRTMPVSRAAVPLGQVLADLLASAVGTVPLLLVGLAMGWRIEGTLSEALAAFGLLLLFRSATTWVGIRFGNAPVPADAAWPVAHPVAGALLWSLGLVAVFAPLAVRRYARG